MADPDVPQSWRFIYDYPRGRPASFAYRNYDDATTCYPYTGGDYLTGDCYLNYFHVARGAALVHVET